MLPPRVSHRRSSHATAQYCENTCVELSCAAQEGSGKSGKSGSGSGSGKSGKSGSPSNGDASTYCGKASKGGSGSGSAKSGKSEDGAENGVYGSGSGSAKSSKGGSGSGSAKSGKSTTVLLETICGETEPTPSPTPAPVEVETMAPTIAVTEVVTEGASPTVAAEASSGVSAQGPRTP